MKQRVDSEGQFARMHTVHKTPLLTLSSRSPIDLDADLLVFPAFEDDDTAGLADLDEATGGEIARARARGEFNGTPFDAFVTPVRGWRAGRVALMGVGRRGVLSPDELRRAAAAAGLLARQSRMTRLAIVLRPGTPVSPDRAAQALAEGAVLANFDGAPYKTTGPARVWLDSVVIHVGAESAAVDRGLERGRVLGECSNMARELCNEPGNRLTPRLFADRIGGLASDAGLRVDILDEARIAELGMGLLLGVARGSAWCIGGG